MPTSEVAFSRPVAPGSRFGGIDLLRILCISLVVFSHIHGVPAVHQWLYPWNMPVFFVLSGYLWKPNRAFLDELRVRSRTLALPYAVWFAIAAAVVLWVPTAGGETAPSALLGPIWGGTMALGPFGSMWSISALFFACLLYRLLDRLPWVAQLGIGLLALIAAYMFGHVLATTPLEIGSAFPLLVFLLAGRGLAFVEPFLRWRAALSIALLAVSALLLAFVPMTPIDLKSGTWGTPGLQLAIALMVSSALILTARHLTLPAALSRFVSLVATGALGVVFGHLVLVHELVLDGVRPLHILVATLVFLWVGSTLVRLTPLSLAITGMPRYRARRTSAEPPTVLPQPVEPGPASG